MSYRHISNLYADASVLMFKTVYAMEKVHGSSARITWKDKQLTFFAGGVKHELFLEFFDQAALKTRLMELFPDSTLTIVGEAFGGKHQGMAHTYGPKLKFVAFEVKLEADGRDRWYSVPDAERIARALGLDFVYYELCVTDLAELDRQRDLPSEEAFKAGMAERDKPETWKLREGIVIRSPVELYDFQGGRFLAKHKRKEFSERAHAPKVGEASVVLTEAKAIADEYVVRERLLHVMDQVKIANNLEAVDKVAYIPLIIAEMIADINREASPATEMTKPVMKQIGNAAATQYKELLQERLQGEQT